MKDSTSSQAETRRPIILRASALEAAESENSPREGEQPAFTPKVEPLSAPSFKFTPPIGKASDASDEVARLNQKLDEYRCNLQQWAQAEIDWNGQRRLFDLMTENVSDLIVLTNREGNRLWSNPAYDRLMGFDAQELTGTYVLTETHPDDQSRAHEALDYVVLRAISKKAEYRVQKRDGTWATLITEIIPIVNAEGKTESILLISSDISEQKRLSEELSMSSSAVTTATMVEAMANDFDQILTNVVGNLTIAKNLNGPHNAVAIRLNEIERSLQRARDLIEQMFSMTPGEGKPKARITLEGALEDPVASILRGTMVRAEYLFPRHLPELELDMETFGHAIRNIVTNSLQAMDKGVVRFTAEVLSPEQISNRPDLPLKAGEYICLRIQDQGHGISEKALSRVFEPYFTTRKGSQGLGLSRALSSIQRMGGTILIESTPGVGTIVSIYIPTVEARDEIAAEPGPSLSRSGPVTARSGTLTARSGPLSARAGSGPLKTGGQKRRILLMDDEQMILDIVSRMLGHLGYDVITCTDGAQAIAAFTKAKSQAEPFDVVMMDLVIPNGVGGEDAVKTIKKIDPSARVIASSGHLNHPVMSDHNKFGFTAVLEKPYKLEKLQQVIEGVIAAPT